MKKPLKIHQKSMPERGRKKGCRNDGKWNQKGAKMEPKIQPKCPQGAKGEPKGRPKGQKGRKKGMRKMMLEFDAEKNGKNAIPNRSWLAPGRFFGGAGGGQKLAMLA